MIIITMAWRNIWRNKMRSLFIMGSVALGLLAGLFVQGLYEGIMEDRIRQVIDTEVSHLQLHHPQFKKDYDPKYVLENPDALTTTLRAQSGIATFTTRIISQGMLATGTGSSGVQIVGVDPEEENRISQLSSKIIGGQGFTEKKRNQVLIGKKLVDKMSLKLNEKIVLTSIDKEGNIVSGAFRIAAIYQTDNAPRDERIVYVRRSDLNSLLHMEDQFHEVALLLKQDETVEMIQAELQNSITGALIETWKEISPETKVMIDTSDEYARIFIIIIMIALSFGIINTMLMAVLERAREIGMLLAVGMNRFRIFYMILVETVFLTLTGAPLGILLTWLVVSFYHWQGIDLSTIGGQVLTEFGFNTVMYPSFPWERMPGQMLVVLGAAILSSLLPAMKAISLKPVEALQK